MNKPGHTLTLPDLGNNLHTSKIAPHLDNVDLRALQLSSRALRGIYQNEQLWAQRLRQLPILPECLFDHPDFNRFTFNYRKLVGILVAGGKAMADLFRDSGEPWQLAALLGEEDQLRKIYNCPRNEKGDVAKRMQEKLIDFADQLGYGIRDYMIFGRQEEAVVKWMAYYKPGYKAADDRKMIQPTLAVMVGSIPMLECLVKHYGYDIKALHPDNESSLLYTSVFYGRRMMTEYLIRQGLSLTKGVKCGQGDNFATIAAEENFWELYEYLQTQYAKLFQIEFDAGNVQALEMINAVNDAGNMQAVMLSAIVNGKPAKYLEMAAKTGIKISSLTPIRKEAYFAVAVQSGNMDMVLLALDKQTGWGLLKHDFGAGRNILHKAAEKGHARLIANLVEKFPRKLDPRATCKAGSTIIHASAVHGCYRTTMQLYQEHFAAHDQKRNKKNKGTIALFQPNKWGRTVVHIAAMNDKLNFLHLLRKDFGDEPFKAVDNKGNTVLHDACEVGACMVALWLSNTVGLSLTLLNKEGESPLHLLVKRAIDSKVSWNNVEGILCQIDFSIIRDNKNKGGDTVKDLLARGKQHGMLNDLEEKASRDKRQDDPSLSYIQLHKH